MKTAIRMIVGAVALFTIAQQATAQISGPLNQASVHAPLSGYLPGHWWGSFTATDTTWGYEESYFTLGTTQGLHSNTRGAWWLMDVRAHATVEGGVFGNVGLGRRYNLQNNKADIGWMVFYDVDASEQSQFGQPFHQITVTGSVRSEFWDAFISGYVPVGQTSIVDNIEPFQGNQLIVPGRDSVYEGFDMRFSVRPSFMQRVGGRIDLGGYYFKTDLFEDFAGIQAGFGFDLPHGVNIDIEVNHDKEQNTTGFLRLVFNFGGTRAWSPSNRGLEPDRRIDHIVRQHFDTFVALNPATGAPWNVIHVDNSWGGAQTGDFETPFISLAQADAVDAANDMIFVWENNAPPAAARVPYTGGWDLLAGQFFLGDGVEHVVPVAGGPVTEFTLPNDQDGFRPIIQNAGADVITSATDGRIAGFEIDVENAASAGIIGTGVTNLEVFNNLIYNSDGAPTGTGIRLSTVTGLAHIEQTRIVSPGNHGIHVDDLTGNLRIINSPIELTDAGLPVAGALAGDGIFVDQTSGAIYIGENASAVARPQTIDSPGANGIHIVGRPGLGDGTVLIEGVRMDSTGTNGIFFEDFDGAAVTNRAVTISNAGGDGILATTNAQASITGIYDFRSTTIDTPGNTGISILNTDNSVATTTINISGSAITGGTGAEGILINGLPGSSTINNNFIEQAATDGIAIVNPVGNWRMSNNTIGDVGLGVGPGNHGIFINNAGDQNPSANFTGNNNAIVLTGADGLHVTRAINATHAWQSLTIDQAGQDGIHYEETIRGRVTFTDANITDSVDVGVLMQDSVGTEITSTGGTIDSSGSEGFLALYQTRPVFPLTVDPNLTLGGRINLTGNFTNNGLAVNSLTGLPYAGVSIEMQGQGNIHTVNGNVLEETLDVNLDTATLDGNGAGVFMLIRGPAGVDGGPNVTTSIARSPSISNNENAGIHVHTDQGATHTLAITSDRPDRTGRTINTNGQNVAAFMGTRLVIGAFAAAGSGVHLTSGGALADGMTMFNARIQNVGFQDNVGDALSQTAGINVNAAGNTNLGVLITDVDIDGANANNVGTGDAIHLTYNVANVSSDLVNDILIVDTNISNIADDGLVLDVDGQNGATDTQVWLQSRNLLVTAVQGFGIDIDTDDATLVRTDFDGATVRTATLGNIDISTNQTSRLIASFDDLESTASGILGLQAITNDTSILVLDVLNSTDPGISNNTLFGVGLLNNDTSLLFGIFQNDVLRLNDQAAADPIDLIATKAAGGELWLELANNTASSEWTFVNNNPGGVFNVDFNNNTPNNIDDLGTSTFNTVGTGQVRAAASPFRTFPR